MTASTTPMKIKWSKLKQRLSLAFGVLTMKYDHWVFISVDRENLTKSLRKEDFEADLKYHGLQPYNVRYIISSIGNDIDPDALTLERAEFEAEAELRSSTER